MKASIALADKPLLAILWGSGISLTFPKYPCFLGERKIDSAFKVLAGAWSRSALPESDSEISWISLLETVKSELLEYNDEKELTTLASGKAVEVLGR
jgi:hypothetical protein